MFFLIFVDIGTVLNNDVIVIVAAVTAIRFNTFKLLLV